MNCNFCKRQLDQPDVPDTEDCGGDCLKCMAEIALDPDCIKAMKILNPRRFSKNMIREFVSYLDTLGLEVVGRCGDVDVGIWYDAMMNYDAEDIIKLRKHLDADTMINYSELHG